MSKIVDLYQGAVRLLQRIPDSLLSLGLRLAMAGTFWQSARTKVDGWNILQPNENTLYLFEDLYHTDWLPTSDVFEAHAATLGEHVFAVMLLLGLGTRLGALGLLAMVVVIQSVNALSSWPTHLLWTSALLVILVRGPGVVSLDHWVAARLRRT